MRMSFLDFLLHMRVLQSPTRLVCSSWDAQMAVLVDAKRWLAHLQARTRRICRLIASGFTLPEIARKLGVDKRTVQRDLDQVFGKGAWISA